MRHLISVSLGLSAALTLAGCERGPSEAEVNRTVTETVNVIDDSNLNDIMLTVGDPEEAVSYFQRTLAANPDRIDLMRDLGKSLIRAGRAREAVAVWKKAAAHPEATNADRVHLAGALIRAGEWDEAERVLDSVPPTHETYKRYRLEAMIADSNEEWKKADSFYEIAAGLTTKPASVLNNWGYSRLTRGDYAGAEKLFAEALKNDPTLFTAKNNLVLARAAQGKYDLPVVPMTQIERAQLLHTAALAAIRRGDINMGKTLLNQAIDTHPQYFEAAVQALAALENNVAG